MSESEWRAKSLACERHCAALESEITEVRGMLALSRDEVVKLRRDLDAKDHECAALRQRVEELEGEIEMDGGSWKLRAEAAEAEVERLRNAIDDGDLPCDCGEFDSDQLVTRGECPDCRKAVLAPAQPCKRCDGGGLIAAGLPCDGPAPCPECAPAQPEEGWGYDTETGEEGKR